jgi:hypothetical protein
VLAACGGDDAVPWIPVNPPTLEPVEGILNYDFYIGTAAEKAFLFETCPGGSVDANYCRNGDLTAFWTREIEAGDQVVFNKLNYRTRARRESGCDWQQFNLALSDGPLSETKRSNIVKTWQNLGSGVHWGVWHSHPPEDLDIIGTDFGLVDYQMGILDEGWGEHCWHTYDLTFDYTTDLIEHSDSIELRDNIVPLGTIAELVGDPNILFDWLQNQEAVRVFSPDQVSIGFGSLDPGSITEMDILSQADFDTMVYACLDADKNGICDYGRAQFCYNAGGDFYNDLCCGVAQEAPLCTYVPSVEAYCADTDDGPKWLPLKEWIGSIVEVGGTCGFSVDAMSNGERFYLCNKTVSLDSAIDSKTSKIQDGMIFYITNEKNLTHDYVCTNGKFMECGATTPFSSIQSAPIGDILSINQEANYCTDDNKWTKSLDTYPAICNTTAGLTWTGTHCCGEPDDLLASYQEDQPSIGACFNHAFIPTGGLIENNTILNYRGKFVFCDPTTTPNLVQSPTHLLPFTTLNPYVYGLCGYPLAAKTSGSKRNAVCNPWGDWNFKSSSNTTYNKSVVWTTIDELVGCCDYTECWDGTQCVAQGDYYKIGNKGFRCV